MENLNRVLLENVLPAHVAEHFLARSLKNEVRGAGWSWVGSRWAWRLKASGEATILWHFTLHVHSQPHIFHFKGILTIHRDIGESLTIHRDFGKS